jgi:hypothetical protein
MPLLAVLRHSGSFAPLDELLVDHSRRISRPFQHCRISFSARRYGLFGRRTEADATVPLSRSPSSGSSGHCRHRERRSRAGRIYGRAWSDAQLIKLAYAYEQATMNRRPPASTRPLR